jgi:signal transduction histidine kinase
MTKIARRDAQTAVRGPSIAELQEQLDIRTRERDEALEQQAATAEVLKVISSSTGKLEPVFQTILENSITICEAKFGMFWLTEGHSFRCVALHGTSPAFTELRRREPVFHPNPTLLSPLGRIARSKQLEHVADCRAEQAYIEGDPGFVALVELAGARTILVVPILWDNELVGAVNIFRQEVRPFTDKQIGLLTSFASQAVIAIENTRLLNELRESLQQQTATADVLKVISSSPGNLEPVFQAILASATEICQTKFGTLNLFENNAFRSVALHNPPPQFKMRLGQTLHPHPDSGLARVARTKQVVHIEDITTEKPYLEGNQAIIELADLAGARTQLSVPMLKEDELLGSMSIYRQEVRPFTDKQIELVENFAAQAVIAIENTRLLNELRQRTHELAASLEDLRTTQDRLVQTQKLALLGQLTAGIAHEIKNPLNFVNNFSGISAELIGELQDTLKGMPLDDNARTEINELTNTLKGNFDKVVHHGRRADAIVKNMLQHSREGSGEHRVVDINALVEESLNLAWHGARAETQGFEIKLKQSFDPSAGSADIFPQDIRRALLNVISNGFYAATRRRAEGNGGDYAPTITASTKNLGDRVEIRIRDNGTGMPPDVKEKMFNPFFTTKPTGEGTGLGLSISHDIIVKQHGGSIEVDSQPGEFTEIRVILPRVAALLPERS